jgi:beta-lactamase class D
MAHGLKSVGVAALGLVLEAGAGLRAQPAEFRPAFERAFAGVEACVVLRDVAPGAEPAVSDAAECAKRAPPCATFDIPATVVALDRGVVPDANAPVRREPSQGPAGGDQPQGISLRDAIRKPAPWVYEEIARRIGAENFSRALGAMRYGNADASGPVERIGFGKPDAKLALSAVEQVDFLARLKRGELPTTAESQARTVEILPVERVENGVIAWKSGACSELERPVAWTVGWVDRAQKITVFAVVESGGDGVTADDVASRMRRLITETGLAPAPAPPPQQR